MRYAILPACVVVLVCLGGLYAWTTFVPALKATSGLRTAQAQLVFGVLIGVFTLTTVPAGRLLETLGPRPLLVASGALFAAGYLLPSLGGGSFASLLVGIGVVAGMATGLGYVCPLVVGIKWFPRHKGLVTGISVAGFGGGAVLLANVAQRALVGGTHPVAVLRTVGIVYGATIAVAALLVGFPPDSRPEAGPQRHAAGSLRMDSFFWALAGAMFCGTFAGLLVIGNLVPMALASGIPPSWSAWGVSSFAAGNAAGRISWGAVVDRAGVGSVGLSLGFLAASLTGFLLAGSNVAAFIAAAMLTGFGFGASFVIHAALVASRYGTARVGSVYPLVFLAYGAAGVTGPFVGAWLYDRTGNYLPSVAASVAVVVLGLVLSKTLLHRAGREPDRHDGGGQPSPQAVPGDAEGLRWRGRDAQEEGRQ